jgi:poly(hydroxyalkanoate) depolymerase family esterase
MARTFAATLRRANRLMHPAKMTKKARSIQHAMSNLMVKSALAPLAALTPTTAKQRKAALPKVGRSLGAVVRQLGAARSLMSGAKTGSARRAASPRIPAGAQYLTRYHRSAAGSRHYKLYLPASHPTRPVGLILMLHGCSQTPDDFAIGTHMNTLAEKHGLAVVYPAQARGHNAASCWNWFQPSHQRRGTGEPAILSSLTRKLTKEFGLDRSAVFVAGLSAGGAMAATLVNLYPEIYSAAGIHSGLAHGSARDVISAMSVMRDGVVGLSVVLPDAVPYAVPVRRIIFQGATDSTVHPSNSARIVAAAQGDDAVPTRIGNRSSGGRDYVRTEYPGSDGATLTEHWMIEGAGHAWSGGRAAGTYSDTKGPDASAQMVRFFRAKSA